jgi:hypothetical protein
MQVSEVKKRKPVGVAPVIPQLISLSFFRI